MSAYRIRLAAEFDSVEHVTWNGIAILLGITIRELLDTLGDKRDVNDLPPALQKLGRRRAAQARAYCDSENPADLMFYWAHQKWGDRVSLAIDTDAHELQLSTDDAEVARWFAAEASG